MLNISILTDGDFILTALTYSEFKKRLSSESHVMNVTITPQLAASILEYHNKTNRPISKDHTKRYANIMKAGGWKANGNPIILNDEGNINDGQTRCAAGVASNTSFVADIRFGVPADTFSTYDIGKSRSNGDLFALKFKATYAGITGKPASKMAGIALAVWRLESDRLKTVANTSIRPDNTEELFDIAENDLNHRAEELIKLEEKLRKQTFIHYSSILGVYVVLHKHNPTKADAFFKELCGLGAGTTTLALSSCLRKMHKRNRQGHETAKPSVVKATIIKGWNAYINNTTLPKSFGTFKSGEAFPKIVKR